MPWDATPSIASQFPESDFLISLAVRCSSQQWLPESARAGAIDVALAPAEVAETVDGNPAPKKPWNDDSPLVQQQPMVKLMVS